MERAKYQQGEWTILTITDNDITIPTRYKTNKQQNDYKDLVDWVDTTLYNLEIEE